MKNSTNPACVGLLLAAGSGRRFDPSGAQNKLLQPLADGRGIAVTAAANMLAALTHVVAVVAPGADALQAELVQAGCEVLVCAQAAEGMGHSLACALQHTADSGGWVVALADMPHVAPHTIAALAQAVADGAEIAAPSYHGVRGNPVAFAPVHLPYLLRLTGDQGARNLLQQFFVTEIAVDDPGIRQDIDTTVDLLRLSA